MTDEQPSKFTSIGELIKNRIMELESRGIDNALAEMTKEPKKKDLVKQLYEVYVLENRFDNYMRYLRWLKINKFPKSKENVERFKKEKLPKDRKYIEPFTAAFFAIRLSHIPKDDLYFVISTMKDLVHRNGYKKSSFTKWLFYSIKPNP
jgi:hypothetical protein